MRVAIALGSNSPDRADMLHGALLALEQHADVRVLVRSRIEETAAIGPPQPSFLNQMLLAETTLALTDLLTVLQRIERDHGRQRVVPKGPRTLDLDIVWADAPTCTSDTLLVPHPGLNDREFWQRELVEVLGETAAHAAIAAARVHAGMDTARPSGVAS